MTDVIVTTFTCSEPSDLELLLARYDQVQQQTPFQSTAWLGAWWRLVGHPSGLRMVLVEAVNAAGRMALPMAWKPGEEVLRSLGEPWADYTDALAIPKPFPEHARQLLAGIAGAARAAQLRAVEIGEVPSASALLAAMTEPWTVSDASLCPRIALTSETVAKIVSRKEHAMKARRLSRLGRITHIEYREADTILGRLAVFFAQHVRQWSARLGSVLTFSDPELACFYAGAVPNLTTVGAVALHELRLDDNPLAFYYGYRDATTFYGYRPSYNIKWKRYSPGALLLRAMVQSFQVQGLTCFDMMRGSESYKLDYATEVTRNKALHLTGLYT